MSPRGSRDCDLRHKNGEGGTTASNADIDRIFGQTMPSLGPDERDMNDSRGAREGDQWLRDNVPPHHG
ncbi:hypothetical protein [Mycobacteroides abscessus]|uniref:Uncharacterized protein n=3 Tax=Mycobacteroides abscessus TaxID=36809 RepID=A0A829PLW8_9MYCO|nr:hypothetical protein [Mycobacteroides abscessus]ETZ88176.1 hypothetical protein L829_1732 [Mycobacteroides abscessus MAB_030201_1075]ETZ92729.1 hypothetical protein L828_3810 [Mycobacteroides abscessus MAB_030201_1061]EUA49009.1 hypothetical protein I543_1238 [Mycobacteroides abscessus 21]AWG52199.1 hypothetical protein DDT48_24385 [Mycobacteroides abscessus]ETZ70803.1 hypothetical protein L835_3726 [Mycobacteroides abscessus MAB_110811_1470]